MMDVKSVATQAKEQIEQWIITEEFKPGQQIKEEQVAQRLGISRPPVREAFKTLESEGVIFSKPRRGVFVSQLSKKDFWEVYTLKAALYEMAIALTVDTISKEEIRRLETIVHEMEFCIKQVPIDLFHYQSLHRTFHDAIMISAGNERLRKFAATLHNQVNRYSYKTLADKNHLISSAAYHKRIISALKKRKSDLACKLMKEHVIKAMEKLINTADLNPILSVKIQPGNSILPKR